MISSEVQRTLVKSPPELWAEISDPESLARHLGEFGEIRITHVKPEQKVEWESDDASGTVVIKSSGWGTKVKLTVTREFAEPEPATEGAVAADGEPRDEQPSVPAPETEKTEQPAQAIELECDDAVEREPHDATVEREPQDATAPDSQLEPDVDDATIAGASVERESPTEPDPVAEAHEEIEPDEDAEMHDAGEPAAQLEPEPRRGFFARLFGRRRAHAGVPSPVAFAEPAPEPDASAPIDDEQVSDALTMQEHDFEVGDQPVHAPEAAAGAVADDPSETGAEPLGELAPQRETQAAEQTLDGRENAASESAEQVAPDEPSMTHTKLAEELAAEEVTAVLTGVLDRLGAAHHRPFSRA